MEKKFSIFGDIVQEADRVSDSDVCLQDFKRFIDTVKPGDNVVIEVCSAGGDVFQGIGICNLIKQKRQEGVKFTAHIVSLAASIASVICCACDEIRMDSNSMFMCHLPWTVVQGNELDLAKQIQQLEQCKKALISFYRSKFDMTDEQIEDMLKAETWIDSSQVDQYKLDCVVLAQETDIRIAAKFVDRLRKFNNKAIVQKVLSMKEDIEKEEKTEEVEKTEDTCEKKAECGECEEEEKKEEVKNEDTTAEEEKAPSADELMSKIRELQARIDELEREKEAPVEARVAGMQSTMQAKINDLTKEFTNQLQATSKELTEYKDKVISLTTELDKSKGELQKAVSALAEKDSALAELNASVNTPKEEQKVDYRKLHGQEFFDWLKKNNIR